MIPAMLGCCSWSFGLLGRTRESTRVGRWWFIMPGSGELAASEQAIDHVRDAPPARRWMRAEGSPPTVTRLPLRVAM